MCDEEKALRQRSQSSVTPGVGGPLTHVLLLAAGSHTWSVCVDDEAREGLQNVCESGFSNFADFETGKIARLTLLAGHLGSGSVRANTK